MILRAGTGEPLGEILSGTSEQVEAGPLLRRMQPGERYVSVHTHPGGQSFSAHDAVVLVAHHQRLIVVAVVGAQGVWYVLSVNPDRAPASPGEVYDAHFQEYDALAPAYAQLVQPGTLTRREAQRQHTHAIWEHIAPALGLRYDRA